MAATVTMVGTLSTRGHRREALVDIACDTSYVTGGYSITPSLIAGFNARIDAVEPVTGNGGLIAEWDTTNNKLKVLYPTGGGAAAPAALAAPIVTSGASTASAVSATTPTLTPGIGKEVLNTTNLSTITFRCWVTGV